MDTREAKRVGRWWDGGLGEMGRRHGMAMKMNPEQIDDEDEDEDLEQIGEAESRWGREKKWEGKRKKEENPEREKERENIF